MNRKNLSGIEYIPPPERDLTALAYAVCQRLAETEPAYQQQAVRSGFAKFLTVVVHIQVQQLNREANPSTAKVS